MASFLAIGATSAALTGLIRDHYPRNEFGSTLHIALYQAGDFAEPMREGFSVFLFRVAINAARNTTPRRTPDGRRYRPSLPLDLQYLITPWAPDVGHQHRMLGWVMRFMEDQSVLSAGRLNHYVAETDIFSAHEGLELMCDPMALGDYLNLWDRLRPRFPTSASYTIRMVSIDSRIEVETGALVQTRAFTMADATP